MCKTDYGCEVGKELLAIYPDIQIGKHIAADPEINDLINTFIRAKVLYQLNGISSLQEEAFRDIGLLEDLELLTELEIVYKEGQNERARKAKRD